jgi:hypothetical protein
MIRGVLLLIAFALTFVPAPSDAAPRTSARCCLYGPNERGTCPAYAAGPIGSPCTCFAHKDSGRICW